MPRTATLTLLMLGASCTLDRGAQRGEMPARPPDFLVDSGVVADLQRGTVQTFSPTQIDGLGGEHVARWRRCGAVQAARAVYTAGSAPERPLTVTVLAFSDAAGAFCGFTPGRSADARAVPELEGAFEDRGLARAWRDNHVIDVTGDVDDSLRDRARGLLRACAARLPGPLKPTIPGAALLPENNLFAGSEHMVLDGALPGVEQPALLAEVRCGEQRARALVMQLPSPELAREALDHYQASALESFYEVSPFERAGASGVHVRADKREHVLFVDGASLIGLLDAPGLKVCDEVLLEIATRAAP